MSTDEPIVDTGLLDNDPSELDSTDDQLRLIFLCCHPSLDRESQIALTLRLVGGLTTSEIAAAFLLPEPTLAQRIVRAKRKIRDAGIPLGMPKNLDRRLAVVLAVLYLIFNESYLSRNSSGDVLRVDLASESIRLTRVLERLTTGRLDHPEVLGLLALQLFHHARFSTRTNDVGELVLLDDQDRTKWDRDLIDEGNRTLKRAMRLRSPGPIQVQAIIAGQHAAARTAADTNWRAISTSYDHLMQIAPSPIVALNRAVAVAMADGPEAGLTIIESLATDLHTYHLFHAARAELLWRAGQAQDALRAFREAGRLTTNPAELRHLQRRIDLVERA